MFKRLCAACVLLTLALLLIVPAFAADMQQGSMYVNTANGKALRFRSSKSTSTTENILTEIPYGTKVYVLDWDGTWARIRYNSAVGYVVQKHLSIAKPEDYATVQANRETEKAEKEALKQLKAENAKLDQSKLKTVDEYDVTVRTGVEDLEVSIYKKANLTSDVVETVTEGARLVVRAENEDWAEIYDGATDQSGYMLLEDLEKDIIEDELLEDDA